MALEPGVPCRICEHCKTGRYNLCERMEFHATPVSCDTMLLGFLSDYRQAGVSDPQKMFTPITTTVLSSPLIKSNR